MIMRKKNILILFFILIFVLIVFPRKVTLLSAELVQEENENSVSLKQPSQDPNEIVIKTYSLKFISPRDVSSVAKLYIIDSTGTEDTITVKILKKNVPKFEELLKKLDIEKKAVLVKVFTVIASKKQETQEDEVIENKDLKRVLNELNSLWKFQSYKIDGPSFLTVKDGSGSNFFKLVSSTSNLNMYILHVDVRGEKPDKRIVSIGQIQLRWVDSFGKNEQTLISTHDVTLKENGYLVVGVSGFPFGRDIGRALILIISAEIK
jgi:hypothetical protein